MAPKKSHTGRVLSLVIGGVIVLGVVTLLLNRKVTGETAERITDAGDTVRQSEAVIQENLKDTCHTLEQTVAPEEGSSIVSNIAAAGEVDVEKVSDEEDSPITSGLKQDNVAQGEKVQEEIRKKIMEMIIKVGNEVYWEREKKYKALDNQELLASDPNAYYRERYTSEEELFDERNCVNTILSRLIPFPSELPPDTVKAMVTDFYRHRFLGHIQRYRIR